MNIAVFAYNFPHKKTQDFLLHLFIEGNRPEVVIAADPVNLPMAKPAYRSKIRHTGLIHPRDIAIGIGARYEVAVHNSERTVDILTKHAIDLGVVAGARILGKTVIDACKMGVLNFHPGLIPEARGLDALLWSIYKDLPLGVTAHLIDSRVDAGRVVKREIIDIWPDDSLIDLSERLYDTQLDMLDDSMKMVSSGHYGEVCLDGFPYNKKMPWELEMRVLEILPDYVQRHCSR